MKSVELIDLGNRLLILADAPVRGQARSSTETDTYAALMTLRNGRVIHAQEYFDHAQALDAAGLEE